MATAASGAAEFLPETTDLDRLWALRKRDAGRLRRGPGDGELNRALDEAGIDRELTYVTNAVKHFKFVSPERGKRRIHQKPSRTEQTKAPSRSTEST